jgi:hypothetical protein
VLPRSLRVSRDRSLPFRVSRYGVMGNCRLQILDCRFANLGLPTALPGKESRLSNAFAYQSAICNLQSEICNSS